MNKNRSASSGVLSSIIKQGKNTQEDKKLTIQKDKYTSTREDGRVKRGYLFRPETVNQIKELEYFSYVPTAKEVSEIVEFAINKLYQEFKKSNKQEDKNIQT